MYYESNQLSFKTCKNKKKTMLISSTDKHKQNLLISDKI